MIDTLSPFTRRVLALGILVLGVLFAINILVVPTIELTRSSLDDLAASTERLARTEAIALRPEAPRGTRLTKALAFIVADRSKAQIALSDLARRTATTAHVTDLVLAPMASPDEQLAEVQVTATAPSAMVLEFVSSMEGAQPLVRFRSWRLAATDPTGKLLRFEGVAVAAWRAP